MIFIDQDNSCGSSAFAFELMERIGTDLAKILSVQEVQEMNDDLQFHKMIWFDELSQEQFNKLYTVIDQATLDDVAQKQVLLECMRTDERLTQ